MDILVIDGDASIQETLKMFFQEKGHEVVMCSTGREALAWGDQPSPDIAIVDGGLPDINGLDLLDRVRSMFPGTGILVIIPRGDEDAWKGAREKGAWGWLEEPLDVENLECALDRVTRPATAGSPEPGTKRVLQSDTASGQAVPGSQARTIEQKEGS